ncbi:heavy metal translocating P-type ATPase [Aurantibacter sp.]|uniref:heavy metal translocating P-type ATPase n=1 Tax=Aurantibacter sp. TaxID=2807103 RepID=UPI0035C7C641
MEICFHCGDTCNNGVVIHNEKTFCCNGCKTVYDILHDNNLDYYYELEQVPGITPNVINGKFDYLDNDIIIKELLDFNEGNTQIASFLIPVIHCSSCIWILENLNRLNPNILTSQVDFPKKTVRISYSTKEISLKDVVVLLTKLGYEPYISLNDIKKDTKTKDRSLIYKLGVAGFAFGNIMFLSFPEYFEVNEFWLNQFKHIFRWLMLAFSLPVVFYSAQDYFKSAYKSLQSKFLNIDVPIALGVSVLFLRSVLEVVLNLGTGFFDSLSGLVFFLLLGKFFQQKTYNYLSFERDYKSYFPIAVTKLDTENLIDELQTKVYDLVPNDFILIRNEELIPVDGILKKGSAFIDYSFVTGEAKLVEKTIGDEIFAGGKHSGTPIVILVTKSVKQSYLTQLWNNDIFKTSTQNIFQSLTDKISQRFTKTLLFIAVLSAVTWIFIDISKSLNVFTAVLIVACPCALALAAPFTLGNLLRILGMNKLYLKKAEVIEQLAGIDAIVFDKTGTLTTNALHTISYKGELFSDEENNQLKNVLRASNHPLSRALFHHIKSDVCFNITNYSEDVGKGISANINNKTIKIGRFDFVTSESKSNTKSEFNQLQTTVHVSINEKYKGYYAFKNEYRKGFDNLLKQLSKNYQLIILSGDNSGEANYLSKVLPTDVQLVFNQNPDDKLEYVKTLQDKNKKVLMIGDGLNDAGALAQSNVGISISENINVFSPACDGILDASMFKNIPEFLQVSKKGVKIIKYAFFFSLFYNLIGLGFAITGYLKPVVAAILMPLSSISIVFFTTISTYFIGKQIMKNSYQS